MKTLALRARVFIHCFLVFGYPGETLALVVHILHQIFDIKSRTSLMYDGSVGICSVQSEIRESDMCKFENNGVTKKFSANESPKMIKECWTKVLMDKSVDGRDQKKTI